MAPAEPVSLLSYRLRKLAIECGDQEKVAEQLRLLLEADRSSRSPSSEDVAKKRSVEPLFAPLTLLQ